ncbi:A/G-specific adenine glycosylase [Pararhodonellum marinum]|uniref:A/G-specific adenine glycosylase n=1 Tax=Pararhodonellum marinum TaxID=2755358 RepID=UPI00188F58FD|nr:A/G-specific adenine glycosylase [Pararhodonellum marinum]
MNFNRFTQVLLGWYPNHKRELPWRDIKDPYKIWLAEIILQQTRVAQGLPYFERFIHKYPTVQDLACAPEEEIMRLWQGLGYYSRARNLHACAKEVVSRHNGNFPDSFEKLLQLKGIGRYTAAAIASFAFLEPMGVVDGNVFRVISRYFGISEDIGSASGRKVFEDLVNQAISKERPDEFNQAIMEFGALQCVPKNPDCPSCPLAPGCFAFQKNMVSQFPVKEKRIKISHRHFMYFYITCADFTIVRHREAGDIWQGLHDFPLEEMSNNLSVDFESSQIFHSLLNLDPNVYFNPESSYRHLLTHQRIQANFVHIKVNQSRLKSLKKWSESAGLLLVNNEKLESLGKPKLIVNFLNDQK